MLLRNVLKTHVRSVNLDTNFHIQEENMHLFYRVLKAIRDHISQLSIIPRVISTGDLTAKMIVFHSTLNSKALNNKLHPFLIFLLL